MPSQEMQDVIDGLRDRQKASASQAPPTLEQRRAAFAPAGRLHPVPDDVMVTEVTEWWSIEVLHAAVSAFRWQEQHDSALIEAALTNGVRDGAWHADG